MGVSNHDTRRARWGTQEGAAMTNTQTPTMTEIFGEPISVYTRADALRDGTLKDVSTTAREAGIRWPVALTAAAWGDLVAWDEDAEKKNVCQDEAGRLWDVLMIVRLAIRAACEQAQQDGVARLDTHVLRVPAEGRGVLPRKAPMTVGLSVDETGQPVITVMLPHED